ncbi:protocadherin Fat 1 [Trichuris trichiura]|uniref:Protocadherin Fat 1 n=1 Tax=Trichuris trichiura TaxID=36087 RepID=A0A077ZBC4_TRITR|nr:protocadherin Fat 1 [Trichuris trichiura]
MRALALTLIGCWLLPKCKGDEKPSDYEFAFTKTSYSVSVMESHTNGALIRPSSKMGIYLCKACLGPVRYKIVSGDPNSLFKVDSFPVGNFAYLRIRMRKRANAYLNREKEPEIVLKVQGKITGPKREATTEVVIKVGDVNDSPPIFASSSQSVAVWEDLAPFSAVAKVHATDADEGLNGEVYYYTEEKNSFFTVHHVTGVVSTARSISTLAGKTATLVVAAEDRTSLLFPESKSITPPNTVTINIAVKRSSKPSPVVHCHSVSGGCRQDKLVCATCILHAQKGYANVKQFILRLFGQKAEHFAVVLNGSTEFEILLNDPRAPYGTHIINLRMERSSDGLVIARNVSLTVAAHCPPFESDNFHLNFTAKESSPPYSVLGSIGPHELVSTGLFRWTIRGGEPWAVGENSGLLFLRGSIGSKRRYSFVVVAHSAICGQRFTFDVDVFVEPENSHCPEFVLPPVCTFSYLSPEMVSQTDLCTLQARDNDTIPANLTYSIVSGKHSDLFNIEETSGKLRLAKPLPAYPANSSFEVRVRVSDDGYPYPRYSDLILRFDQHPKVLLLNTEPISFEVLEKADNNHAPVFLHTPFPNLNIFENATVGREVFRFEAVDYDLGFNGLVRYSIAAGNHDDRWRINMETGVLSLHRPLDREEVGNYELTIVAQDFGDFSRKTTATLLINVLDSNDNKPLFEQFTYYASIPEDVPIGYRVIQLRADDADLGINAIVSYHIVTATSWFGISPDNGTIVTLHTLDREKVDRYELIVQAVDKGWPSLSSFASLIIDVTDCNDNPPTCLQPVQHVEIPEDVPSHFLFTCVNAYDRDEGVNAMLRYELPANASEVVPFEIDSETGCLRTVGKLDFSKRPIYNLKVQVTDRGVPAMSELCEVEIVVLYVNRNRFPPEFDRFVYEAAIFENEPPGTIVTTLKARDRDSDRVDDVAFSIVGGDGMDVFVVDQKGVVRSRRSLDREMTSSYWLVIEATDQQPVPLASTVDLFIMVKDRNDNAPVPSRPIYITQVLENCPARTVILQLNATDADESSYPLTYAIKKGNAQSLFTIDADTGTLLSTERKIDREANDVHLLEVEITDSGIPPLSSSVSVMVEIMDENDHSPQFLSLDQFDVPACSKEGQYLCRISAFDKDAGLNGTVRYSLSSDEENIASIRIDENTGDLFCLKPIPGATVLSIVVDARDLGEPPLKSEAAVRLKFFPVPIHSPNHVPILPKSHIVLLIDKYEKLGSDFAKIDASDPDNDQLWFYLKDDNRGHISLAVDSGIVYLIKHAEDITYNVSFFVTDGIDVADGVITLVFNNRKYQRPVLEKENYFVQISANATLDSVIVSLRDSIKPNDTGIITYSLVNSFDGSSKFIVDGASGDILLAEPLDTGTTKRYLLMVEARSYHMKTCAFVHVEVIRADSPPRFPQRSYEVKIPQSTPVGHPVIQMAAYDANTSSKSLLSYALSSGDEPNVFEIHPTTGMVTTRRDLHSIATEHFLTVVVSSKANPSLTDTAELKVSISANSQEYARFPAKIRYVQLYERTPIGNPVLTMQAEGSGYVHYFLNDSSGTFEVNGLSGCVTLKNPLDASKQSHFEMRLIARSVLDREDIATIVVTVIPSTPRSIQFGKSVYYGYIKENNPEKAIVKAIEGEPLLLTAHGPLVNQSVRYNFRIVEPWAKELFIVDQFTGAVLAATSLDREKFPQIVFHVMATDVSDSGLQSRSPAMVVVRIEDSNDNPPKFVKDLFQAIVHLPTAPGVPALRLSAKDPDGDDLRFSLLSDGNGTFKVDSETGEVTLARADPSPTLYKLKAAVSDGSHSSETDVQVRQLLTQAGTLTTCVYTLQIQISPSLPEAVKCAESVYFTSVTENSRRPEPLLLVKLKKRPSAVVYFLLLNGKSYFVINSNTGLLSFNGVPLDREAQNMHTLIVQVVNFEDARPIAQCVVTVQVKDVNDCPPVFLNSPYNFVVHRHYQSGTLLGIVEAVDLDEGRNSVVSYEASELNSADAPFLLNSTSGEVSLKKAAAHYSSLSQLNITVIARDHGIPSLSASTLLTVVFLDKGTFRFSSPAYSISVPEGGSMLNKTIARLSVASVLPKAHFVIISGNDGQHFVIDESLGSIRPQKLLDREMQSNFTLHVQLSDENLNMHDTAQVFVDISDVNDNPPIFTRSVYNVTVPEDSRRGRLLTTLIATDGDIGDNAKLRYRIRRVTPSADYLFRLDPLNGSLILAGALDFDLVQAYKIEVECSDAGVPELLGFAIVEVSVEDVNNNAPFFEFSTYTLSVPGDLPAGQVLGIFLARDADTVSQGKLKYTLNGLNSENLFSLDPDEAVLTVNRSLLGAQRSNYKLKLVVDDGLFSSSCDLLMQIVRPSEGRPAYKERVIEVSVPESAIVGSVLTSAEMSSAVPVVHEALLGDLEWLYVHQDTGNSFPDRFSLLFDVAAYSSGLVSLKEPLDYEVSKNHDLIVGAKTAEGIVSTAHIVVNVLNQNDHKPVFVASKFECTVSVDDPPGTALLQRLTSRFLQLLALDEDPMDKVEYSIKMSRRFKEADKHFEIDATSGVVRLRRNLSNFAGTALKFSVVATDSGNPPLSDEATVSIYVSPDVARRGSIGRDTLSLEMRVSEAAPVGTPFGRVRFDPFSDLLVRIVKPADVYVGRVVQVVPNGTVSVAEPLDRELRSRFWFYVYFHTNREVGAWMSMVLVGVTVLDVNDNAPNFGGEKLKLAVAEDAPVGYRIVRLQASDPDEGDAGLVSYRLNDLNLPFKITGNWLVTKQQLDRETNGFYHFTVTAKDAGSPSLSSNLAVEIDILGVNDKAPIFENKSYQFHLAEEASANDLIGTIRAVDPDEPFSNHHLKYYIIRGNALRMFSLTGLNGSDSFGLLLTRPIPKANGDHFDLRILVSDGKFTDTTNVRIKIVKSAVVDCQCEKEVVHLTLSEDWPLNKAIFNFSWTVSEHALIEGSKKFKFFNGKNFDYICSPAAASSIVLAEKLDRETASQHYFRALYKACNALDSCFTSFVVTVSDVNDNRPLFTSEQYEVSIVEHENISYPKYLLRVHAVDYDLGEAGTVSYSMLDSFGELFLLNETTGDVFLTKPLDREEKPNYTLNVQASDNGVQPLSSNALIRVVVLDVNDNPPVFTQHQYNGQIPENASDGMEVLRVEAFSLDEGVNAQVGYSLLPSSLGPLPFTIDEVTGSVRVSGPLDAAKQSEYELLVQATDKGSPPLSSKTTVRVEVIDVNDHSPVFTENSYNAEVMENAAAGTLVVHCAATDQDTGRNGRVGYRLLSSQQAVHDHFNISEVGWLILKRPLDREKIASLEFKVEAFDFGLPSRSAFASVHVTVLDTNDNPPTLDKCNDTVYMRRPVATGTVVHQFVVTDLDDREAAGVFRFELKGVASSMFEITATAALKVTASNLTDAQYLLMIRVSDGEHFTECQLDVRLVEGSIRPPVVRSYKAELWTYMDEFAGGLLGQIRATDEDPMDKLTYRLKTPPLLSDIVTLDLDDGQLMAAAGLPVGDYTLKVAVSDGKFTSNAVVELEVQSATYEMLRSAVSLRLGGVDVDKLLEHGLKRFQRSISKHVGVRPRYVHIFSLDQSQPDSLEIFVAFQKSKQEFYTPAFVRDRLDKSMKDLALSIGAREVRILQDRCSSNPCVNGQCKETVVIDETGISSILSPSFGLITPRAVRSLECHCPVGFEGSRCEKVVNVCSSNPCGRHTICVPNDLSSGYHCECLPGRHGKDCSESCRNSSCSEPAVTFLGSSYVWYPLDQSLEAFMNLTIRVKTSAHFGSLLFSKGRTDYQVLDLRDGFVQYRFDLGSGQTVVRSELFAADNLWHTVRIVRKQRHITLIVDNALAKAEAFGSSTVLNLNRASYICLGGELETSGEVKNGFVGCMHSLTFNGNAYPILTASSNVRLVNIRRDCPAKPYGQDVADVDSPCRAKPCLNGGRCSPGPAGSFICACSYPYFGKRCENWQSPCLSQPCLNGGVCEVLAGNAYCRCPEGFSGATCDQRLSHGSECGQHQCANGGYCVGKPDGTYFCNCTDGWTGILCDIPTDMTIPNISTGRLGITLTELATVLVVLLALAGLGIAFFLVCKRRRRLMYEKVRVKRARNEEILLDQPFLGNNNMSIFPGGNGPPPLPPRFRSFQSQRQKRPSNFESGKLVRLPMAQVRPLSFIDRPDSPVCCPLQAAVNYGSAAEELEQIGQASDKDEVEDWKSALNKMDVDSLNKLKKLAGLDDDEQEASAGVNDRASSKADEHGTGRANGEGSSSFIWDYSDWASTVGNTGYPTFGRHTDTNTDDETASVPRVICRLDDTDYEYALDSCSDHDDSPCSSLVKK